MALLDWSDPHKTPRGSSFAQQAASDSPPRGRADADLSTASARPLTGCMADYDALAIAVRAYRATYGRWAYEAMRDAAMRCGMPEGYPPLAWSVARLKSYRNLIGA